MSRIRIEKNLGSVSVAVNDPAKWLLDLAAPQVLTLNEGAVRLGIDSQTLEALIQEGKIQPLFFKDMLLIATYQLDYYESKVKGIGLQFKDNQYIGVNPHLMSLLQTPGSQTSTSGISTASLYPSFHNGFIEKLNDILNEDLLPPNYIAQSVTSLQISTDFDDSSHPEPDIPIYKDKTVLRGKSSQSAAHPNAVWPLVIEEKESPLAVGIFRVDEDGHLGKLVTGIEVLSPTNMPGQPHGLAYRDRRAEYLKVEISLVEVDFLHEYRSPVPGVPSYPQSDESNPFVVTVSHPKKNEVALYGSGINIPLPLVAIPLEGDEAVDLPLQTIYDRLWKAKRYGKLVDYSLPPDRIEKYRSDDQQAIRDHMQLIAQR